VFGDGIGGCAGGREEPGGGYGHHEVAVALAAHLGQVGARGMDVGHEVDAPDAVPLGVRDLDAAGDENAGVGTEEVEASEAVNRLADKELQVGFGRDVGRDCDRAQRGGCRGERGGINVGEDEGRGLFAGEALSESESDAAGGAGDQND